MSRSNTHSTYGSVTKMFHWATVILIFLIIPLGLYANGLPYETSDELAFKALIFSMHKTAGVAVFFVALARILWALTQTKPGGLHPERKAETLLAEIVHWMLYGSLVIAPLTGWIHHAATSGFAPIWWPFGQNLPLIPKDETLSHTFASLHFVLTKVMAAAIFLHVAGALKHQFVDKDATLRRMWFASTNLPDVIPHRSAIAAPAIATGLFAAISAATISLMPATGETAPMQDLAASSTNWTVQDGTLGLTVIQLGSEVSGEFANWEAAITYDPNTQRGNVEVVIDIASLSLGSVTAQAMGADFFDTTNHPTAVFTGDISSLDGTLHVAKGTLTIKDITIPMDLTFDLTDADGVWTMNGSTAADRRDFEVGASMPDETNLGFPVRIDATLTATQTP